MSKSFMLRVIFFLTMAGLAFSGYLSLVKLFTKNCAFNETCPYFLGYPACWYGFAMYLLMFVIVLLALKEKINAKKALNAVIFISLVGILFSGNFVLDELVQSNIIGVLGLSTCAYGMIFYILIFILSLVLRNKKEESVETLLSRENKW